MARVRFVDIDQTKLERAGFYTHATTLAGEFVNAIRHSATFAIIWDHDARFGEILSKCRKPALTAHDLSSLAEQGMILTDEEDAIVAGMRCGGVDNSGWVP